MRRRNLDLLAHYILTLPTTEFLQSMLRDAELHLPARPRMRLRKASKAYLIT